MRLLDPFTRNVPSISVAEQPTISDLYVIHSSCTLKKTCSPFSFKNKPLQAASTDIQCQKGMKMRGMNGNAPLGDDDRNITPDIQLPIRVRRRYLHIRILQTLLQRAPKYRACGRRPRLHMRMRRVGMRIGGRLGERMWRVLRRGAHFLRCRELLPPRAQSSFIRITLSSSSSSSSSSSDDAAAQKQQ